MVMGKLFTLQCFKGATKSEADPGFDLIVGSILKGGGVGVELQILPTCSQHFHEHEIIIV